MNLSGKRSCAWDTPPCRTLRSVAYSRPTWSNISARSLVRLFQQLFPRHHPRATAASRCRRRGSGFSALPSATARHIQSTPSGSTSRGRVVWADATVEQPDNRRRGAHRERRHAEPPAVHPHGLRSDRGTPLSVSRSVHGEHTRRRGGVRSECVRSRQAQSRSAAGRRASWLGHMARQAQPFLRDTALSLQGSLWELHRRTPCARLVTVQGGRPSLR